MTDTTLAYYLTHFPHHRTPLEFLQHVIEFQTALAEKIEAGRPTLTQPQAKDRWNSGHPLFSGETGYPIDLALFWETLARLPPALHSAAGGKLAAEGLTQATLDNLVDAFVTGSEAHFQQIAHALATAPEALAFLLQTILPPFFEKAAQPYQPWLQSARWRGGTCPVCGAEPLMARLTAETGRRILTCSLCRTNWSFDRLRCPFCDGDAKHPSLNYFTVDDDNAHRAACCDQCHRYLKTVDERMINHPVNLWAENVITAHLDAIANQQGFG